MRSGWTSTATACPRARPASPTASSVRPRRWCQGSGLEALRRGRTRPRPRLPKIAKTTPCKVESQSLVCARQGVRLALVTNGAADTQRAKVERFMLAHRFEHVQIEGEHGFGKPDERAYLHAMEALGVTAP